MAGKGAPAPLIKPSTLQCGSVEPFQFALPKDTAGMFQLKLRKPVKLLPKPTTCVPFSEESPSNPKKRKYSKPALIMCKQCKSERVGPSHKQYMGYRYCATTALESFEDWRAALQAKQVHLKLKRV